MRLREKPRIGSDKPLFPVGLYCTMQNNGEYQIMYIWQLFHEHALVNSQRGPWGRVGYNQSHNQQARME